MYWKVDIYLSCFLFRIWVEESYFQPVGQRTISNQALYQNKDLIVIYSSFRSGTIKMINYVKNRAVAVATEILDGLHYKTDIKTHSNIEYLNKQVILLNFIYTSLKAPSRVLLLTVVTTHFTNNQYDSSTFYIYLNFVTASRVPSAYQLAVSH